MNAPRVLESPGIGSLAPLGASSPTDVFATSEWFELLATHGMAPKPDVRVFSVTGTDGGPSFALPMMDGPELTSLSNYYSCLYAPVAIASPRPEQIQCLCDHLRRRRSTGVIRLQPLDTDSDFTQEILKGLRRAGFWADTFFCFGNWYLPLDGRGHDAWFASLPGRLRSTVARRRRKVENEGGWSTSIMRTPGAELETAIADFVRVYARSWKVPEPHPDFIPELCRLAARRGWLRLGVMRRGEAPVAAQLWLHCAGRSLIYKLAYDDAFAQYSAGTILTADMMRHAMEVDRAREIDYLSGDDAYKRDWMSHRRERIGIVAFNPRLPRGLAAGARHFAGRAAKTLKQALETAR